MEKNKLISLKTGIKNAYGKLINNESMGFTIKSFIAGMAVVMGIMLPIAIILNIVVISSLPKTSKAISQKMHTPTFQSAEFIAPEMEESFVNEFIQNVEEGIAEEIAPEEQPTEIQLMEEAYQPKEFSQQVEGNTQTDWDSNETLMKTYNDSTKDQGPLLAPPYPHANGTPVDMPSYTPKITGAMLIVLGIGSIIGIVVMAFFGTLNTLIIVKVHNRDFVQMKALVKEAFKKTPKFMVLALIITTITVIGYILLIIPGIILTICFMFAPYILLSEDTGILEAMKKSKALVKGYKLALYGRGILFTIFLIILIIPLFFLAYALGGLIMPLFGTFKGLVLMEFLDDLKEKQSSKGVVLPEDPKPTASPIEGAEIPEEKVKSAETIENETNKIKNHEVTQKGMSETIEPEQTERVLPELPDLPEPLGSVEIPEIPETPETSGTPAALGENKNQDNLQSIV